MRLGIHRFPCSIERPECALEQAVGIVFSLDLAQTAPVVAEARNRPFGRFAASKELWSWEVIATTHQ
jgi:hypothetical protein